MQQLSRAFRRGGLHPDKLRAGRYAGRQRLPPPGVPRAVRERVRVLRCDRGRGLLRYQRLRLRAGGASRHTLHRREQLAAGSVRGVPHELRYMHLGQRLRRGL